MSWAPPRLVPLGVRISGAALHRFLIMQTGEAAAPVRINSKSGNVRNCKSLLPSCGALWCSYPASGPLVALPFFGRANFEAGGPRQGVEAHVRLALLGLHRCTLGEGSERARRLLHPRVLTSRIFVALALRARGV